MKNWIQPWLTLGGYTHTLMTGAPEVIARRTKMLSAKPWDISTALEAQGMVWEKWMAMQEGMMAGWTTAQSQSWRGNPMHPSFWWLPRAGAMTRPHPMAGVHTLNAALKPMSTRVKGNVTRLRRKAKK